MTKSEEKRNLEIDMERAIGACQALARRALEILDATDNPLESMRHAEKLMHDAAKQMSNAATKRLRINPVNMEEPEIFEP